MSNPLDIAEKRFLEILITIGAKTSQITMPDKQDDQVGGPDFQFKNCCFEVKQLLPNKDERADIMRLYNNVISGKVEAYFVPAKLPQFKADVKSAAAKFKRFPRMASVLVEDLTTWGWHEPDIEAMLFGQEAIIMDSITGDHLGNKYNNRILRVNSNRTIGTYIFMKHSKLLIYHNKMAYSGREMPLEICKMFAARPETQQFFFMNHPSGPPEFGLL